MTRFTDCALSPYRHLSRPCGVSNVKGMKPDHRKGCEASQNSFPFEGNNLFNIFFYKIGFIDEFVSLKIISFSFSLLRVKMAELCGSVEGVSKSRPLNHVHFHAQAFCKEIWENSLKCTGCSKIICTISVRY